MKGHLKILIVSPRLPNPKGKADSMTVYFMCKFFAQQGHDVFLIAFDSIEEESESLINDLNKFCYKVKTTPLSKWKSKLKVAMKFFSEIPAQSHYYQYSQMGRVIKQSYKIFKPDFIYGHLIRVSEYLKDIENTPKILGMQIAQSLNLERLVKHERNYLVRFFYKMECKKVKAYEPHIIPKFDRVLLISPHDKKAIDPQNALQNVFFNPHGIDVAYYASYKQTQKIPNSIVMNGDFGTPTNIDAILFFYEEIYPLIKKEIPDVNLWIVGRNPAPPVRRLGNEQGINVTGRVDDIRPYLHQAMVAIDPLRVGAGLQNKILVSMAASLPVVSTPIGNEGINASLGDVILIGNDVKEFADKVVYLLKNEDARMRIGKNAQEYMFKYWTWEYHFKKLEEMLLNLKTNSKDHLVENYYPFSQNEASKIGK